MSQLALGHRREIKAVTGVGITQNATPMLILRQLLSCIGYSLNYIRARGSGQNRTRIYQIAEPQDDREKIFAQWLRRDMSNPGSSEPQFLEEIITKDLAPNLSSLPVQLTIDL